MGLNDDFEAESYGRNKGPTCQMALLLATMPEEDLAATKAAMSNPRWTATGITRALNKNGYPVTLHTLQRHRRGDCQCR